MWAAGQPSRADPLELAQLVDVAARSAQWSGLSARTNVSNDPAAAHARLHGWNVSSHGVAVAQSRYWAACNDTKPPWWAAGPEAFWHLQIRRRAFVPRTPLELTFCWERDDTWQAAAVAQAAVRERRRPREILWSARERSGGN